MPQFLELILSFIPNGNPTEVSQWRVRQIRRESGMPSRAGGRRGNENPAYVGDRVQIGRR